MSHVWSIHTLNLKKTEQILQIMKTKEELILRQQKQIGFLHRKLKTVRSSTAIIKNVETSEQRERFMLFNSHERVF